MDDPSDSHISFDDVSERFREIADAVKKFHPNPDLEVLLRAYRFAELHHSKQLRANGDPYFFHLVETALLVCKLKLDIPSIAAALLHDVIEDCNVQKIELEQEFGSEIVEIVEGVTNLTRMEFSSKEERQAENFRKMLLAMARDIRVVLVKLCDRLHNMRTLQYVSVERQIRKANETKDIYAPLANRLGIHWLKSELEDLCFRYLRSNLYQQMKESLDQTRAQREDYIRETCEEIVQLLEASGISASVKGRAKHFYSIWQKMERENLSLDEIHDLLGFRIVVPTLRGCYEALGIVHSRWKPVTARFKDYVAMPKPNMYQSLHTTVIGPGGQRIEIQIRTPEMNKVAEDGIAAHWRYKEGGSSGGFDLQWVKDLVETQQYLKNPDEFIQSVKGELFPEEVFVFTPRGDLFRLPFESTPVDFAYAVHTDIGHTTSGARVNGSFVPLHYKLENGDTVEILTSKNHKPNKDWLEFVRSSKAKQRIRAFLKSEEHDRSTTIGIEILTKDLRKVKLGLKKLEKDGTLDEIASSFGLKSKEDLYAEIGYGKLSSTKVITKVVPEETNVEEKLLKKDSALQRIFQRAAKATRDKVGVRVGGLDDLLVRFAQCCEPLPGDRIVGFVTRGRGVTIHSADCAQVLRSDPIRRIEVSWDNAVRPPRKVRIVVHAEDTRGLLLKVTQCVNDENADIRSAQIKTTEFNKAVIDFEISIEDSAQLRAVTRAIERVAGVIRVERVTTLAGGREEDEL